MKAACREFGPRDKRELLAFLTKLGPERVIGVVPKPCSMPNGVTGFVVFYWRKGAKV